MRRGLLSSLPQVRTTCDTSSEFFVLVRAMWDTLLTSDVLHVRQAMGSGAVREDEAATCEQRTLPARPEGRRPRPPGLGALVRRGQLSRSFRRDRPLVPLLARQGQPRQGVHERERAIGADRGKPSAVQGTRGRCICGTPWVAKAPAAGSPKWDSLAGGRQKYILQSSPPRPHHPKCVNSNACRLSARRTSRRRGDEHVRASSLVVLCGSQCNHFNFKRVRE